MIDKMLNNSFNIRSSYILFKYLLILLLFFIFIELINIKLDRYKSSDDDDYNENARVLTPNIEIVKVDEKIKKEEVVNENDEHYMLFQKFIKELRDVSNIQKLVSVEALITTLKFMIQDVDEYDPALIEFVRSQIRPPTDRSKLSLREMGRTDFSQIGQSGKIDGYLNKKENGFFIEAGAYDGETFSNTLFFELNRNWTGILIEPVPSFFHSVLSKKRNCYALNACIAAKKPFVAKFKVHGALSGREDEMSKFHLDFIQREVVASRVKEETAYIPCFSLNTIMRALGRKTIDYFSLDVEGAELPVLQSIDYTNLDIRAFSIEYAAKNSTKPAIIDHLEKNNYKLVLTDVFDIYFVKNGKKWLLV